MYMRTLVWHILLLTLALNTVHAETAPHTIVDRHSLAEKALRKLNSGSYKDAIKLYQELVQVSTGEQKGESLKQLAKAYYHDQDQVRAFETFLEALRATPPPQDIHPPLTKDEKILYDEALRIYLDPRERDPEAVSMKLRDSYAGIWRLYSNYHYLGYLIAIAFANLSDFDDFFDAFYSSYTHIPDHYLAYKTQAILHIKLFERARTPEEKDKERREILQALEETKKRYPNDPSLYRMQIAFSPEASRKQVLEHNLNEIITGSMIVPRSDLSFYFDQLLAYGKIDLARAFLTKAREWYHYSRTLDAADEMIKEKQK
jgi:tetratricopeptide (TPR) repeat protein